MNIYTDTWNLACPNWAHCVHFLEVYILFPDAVSWPTVQLDPRDSKLGAFQIMSFLSKFYILHQVSYNFPHNHVLINILPLIPDVTYLVKILPIFSLLFLQNLLKGLFPYALIHSKSILYTEGKFIFQKCELINITLLL